MSAELLKSVSFDAWAAVADGIRERMARVEQLNVEMRELADSIGIDSHTFRASMSAEGFDRCDPGDERVERDLHRALWRRFADLSGLLTMLDRQGRDDFFKGLKENPARFDKATVLATFEALQEKRGELFIRGLVNAMRQLSLWHFKSNQPFKLGRRTVTRVGRYYEHRDVAPIDDLARAFAKLDNKPAPDSVMDTFYRVHSAAGVNVRDAVRRPMGAYFEARCFKNGNVHLYFTRPDLVDAVNKTIAARYPHALAPSQEN